MNPDYFCFLDTMKQNHKQELKSNIMRHLRKWMASNKTTSKDVTTEIVQKKLSESKGFRWYRGATYGHYLDSSRFKSTKKYQTLLKCISEIKHDIVHLCFWNSELDHRFFMALSNTGWALTHLQFYDCQLSDNFSLNLTNFFGFSCLKSILIDTDPIGNRGISVLLKLRLDQLGILKISNTNVTTDVVKVLKKHSKGFRCVGFYHQDLFREDVFMKQTVGLCPGNSFFTFCLQPVPETDKYFYFCHLSKHRLDPFFKRKMLFLGSGQGYYPEYLETMMVPRNLTRQLERVFKFSLNQ